MAWTILVAAGLMEAVWAVALQNARWQDNEAGKIVCKN